MDKEYTTGELADLFKINPEAVHNYLIKNDIPFIKASRTYLISKWDLTKKKRSIRRKRD